MAADIQRITQGNDVELLSDRELAEETLRVLRSLDITLSRMMSAWSAGGVRGLRRAAASYATPDRPVAGCPHEPACLNAALCLSAR